MFKTWPSFLELPQSGTVAIQSNQSIFYFVKCSNRLSTGSGSGSGSGSYGSTTARPRFKKYSHFLWKHMHFYHLCLVLVNSTCTNTGLFKAAFTPNPPQVEKLLRRRSDVIAALKALLASPTIDHGSDPLGSDSLGQTTTVAES